MIRINDKITTLDPKDTYMLMDGERVVGFTQLKDKVDDHEGEITKLKAQADADRVGKTFAQLVNKTTAPDYPTEPMGNYIISVSGYDENDTAVLVLPNPVAGMLDRCIVTVINNSLTTLKIQTGSAPYEFQNDATEIDLGVEFFATFFFDHSQNKLLELEQGYIPTQNVNHMTATELYLRHKGLIHTFDEIEGDGFLKGVQVTGTQGGEAGIKSIQFKNGVVTKVSDTVVSVETSTVPDPTTVTLHFKDLAAADAWKTAHGANYQNVIALIDDNGQGVSKSYEWTGTQWQEYNLNPPPVIPSTLVHDKETILVFDTTTTRDAWTNTRPEQNTEYYCVVTYSNLQEWAYFYLPAGDNTWVAANEPSATTADDVVLSFRNIADRDAWIKHAVDTSEYTSLIANEDTGVIDFYLLKPGASTWEPLQKVNDNNTYVKSGTFNPDHSQLILTLTDDTTVPIDVPDFNHLESAAFDTATEKLNLKMSKGDIVSVSLPAFKHVQSGSFDPTHRKLTLTMTDNQKVDIDVPVFKSLKSGSFTPDSKTLKLVMNTGDEVNIAVPDFTRVEQTHKIYYGFTDNNAAHLMTSQEVGTASSKDIVRGHVFQITRPASQTAPQHYFVWVAADANQVLSFGFGTGGFTSIPLQVGGDPGTVYVGPHATHADVINLILQSEA